MTNLDGSQLTTSRHSDIVSVNESGTHDGWNDGRLVGGNHEGFCSWLEKKSRIGNAGDGLRIDGVMDSWLNCPSGNHNRFK